MSALNFSSPAQDYFRMSADFTTKVKPAQGKASLTRGKVFYDKYTKELIYDISFPSKEKWITQDSRIYKVKNDSIYSSDEIPNLNEFSIFHLSLNSTLSYYGLREARFTISKVDKKGDLVISYWDIPQQIREMIGNIAVAKKGNRLHSVVIAGPEENILSKQFFQDYIKTGGFEFPGKIVQIYYNDAGEENYQVTEFKNIILNDTENEESYHYQLDKL
ncbi:MAG: hypothetical protein ACOC1D_00170 [Prolixibacteraceae bacterium]